MQPDDLSMPRSNNGIKEKLNIHLKKRLLETSNSSEPTAPSATNHHQAETSSKIIEAPLGPAPPLPKIKKQKTKHLARNVSTTQPNTSATTVVGTSRAKQQSAMSAAITSPPEVHLSPGNGNNSNDSSFNSADMDPEAGTSNDGQSQTDKSGAPGKSNAKPDIFSMILNEKKSSLMRDPEVIKFLQEALAKRK
ncbi:uncharacterized protein LOC129759756 [Uranotaenia lowii]|uniref:uncharacterized protein LOC129759756 n=1 Tax=Uranotaenia lowii TaxID=190385 RepID=UPI00247A14C2|nr:uncharacterized protein LOC129759756 [Uranotaenia lowii]